jgi:MGT family glycosyltransferase
MLALVARLAKRGHAVRVLGDPCNREEVESAGAWFVSWSRAPRRADKSPASDPLRDWEVKSPPAMIGRLRDRLFVGPSLEYAQDVLSELERFPADVIVTSEMLFGPMTAAEAAGIPCVALSANVYLFPRRGVPPFGPGLQPSSTAAGRVRDWMIRTMAMRGFAKGTGRFNEIRRALGLDPVRHPFDQLQRLAYHLVLTSEAFDFQSTERSETIVYAGPELGDPAWAGPWQSPWPAEDHRLLVLVGFSTTFQNQADALRRVIEALGSLDVRAIVTAGPSMDVATLPSAPGIHVCESAPHSELLREAAAVVTHAGHGTVIRALAAGVPLVCMPMGRDQNETAARVVYHGAGVRLNAGAAPEKIRQAVKEILAAPRYRERARALGEQIVRDARGSRAVALLEHVAAQRDTRGRHSGQLDVVEHARDGTAADAVE